MQRSFSSIYFKAFKKISAGARSFLLYSFVAVLFFIGNAAHAHASDLVLSPNSGTAVPGSAFSVEILVSNNTQAVNAVSGTLSFPTSLLSVTSISKDGSIIKLWADEPSYSNSLGTVHFEGVILNPGFSGARGKVLTVVFSPKKIGSATLAISDGSILANDGKATELISQSGRSTIVISKDSQLSGSDSTTPGTGDTTTFAPKITSKTHPDPNKWYNNDSPVFSWSVPDSASEVAILYDHLPSSIPSKVYSPVISEKSIGQVPDGIYYLHVRFKSASGWGPVSHFRFQIDTVPPEPFRVEFPHGSTSEDPQPIIHFNTTDTLSGIARYEVKIGSDEMLSYTPDTLSNPYAMPPQNPGIHTVLVRAIDRAGNSTTESADFEVTSIQLPVITSYPKEVQEGDTIKVRGTTYPNSTVNLVMEDVHGEKFTDFTKSNSGGDFATVWSKKLYHGVYHLTAMVTDDHGAKSLYTTPVNVEIVQAPIIRIGVVAINYLSLVIIIICGLAGLGALVWYVFSRFVILKKKIRRDIVDAESAVHIDFDGLKDNITRELKILEKAKANRSLSKEESTVLTNINKHIAGVEKDIKRALDTIKKDAK